MEELHATYLYERRRWDDVALIECEPPQVGQGDMFAAVEPITIKVRDCKPGELDRGLSYRFYGKWANHPKYGKQFNCDTFHKVQPHSQLGVIAYLLKAPNVGMATAKALWTKFQGQAVQLLRERPEVAATAVGGQFSLDKAKEAAAYLEKEKALESCTIDMASLLAGRGFPRDTGKKAIEHWGNKAPDVIEHNPFRLMRFRGCGFLKTDQMYLDLKLNPHALKRQALCVWHAMARDTEGHTWHSRGWLITQLRGKIGGTQLRAADAVKLARRAGIVAVRRVGEELWFAEGKKAAAEATIAEIVAGMMRERVQWPALDNIDVSDHQRSQLVAALGPGCPIAILTGGPGTGKTYTTARLTRQLIAQHGADRIAACAPTGKAAVRLTELLAGYGLSIKARTIHRTLGVASTSEGDGWTFEHNAANPLEAKVIIVDESSMIDTGLMASLLSARSAGALVLFVGDPDQLPPVGHGRPFYDLIAAGVPTGKLTKLHRNSGTGVLACEAIRQGKRFATDEVLKPADGMNLRFIAAGTGEAAADSIVSTIKTMAAKKLCDPVWGCQVIVAVNKKSPLSRAELNLRLQRELNPNGEQAGSNPFRVGDKIVCLKNGWMPLDDNANESPELEPEDVNEKGQVYVANGEQARVLKVADKLTIARLEAPERIIRIPRGEQKADDDSDGDDDSASGCQFDLAYAISCHKSQGSEWPVVILAIDDYPGARMVCCREWLRTGISRFKFVCLLVGKKSVAEAMIGRQAIGRRKTFLVEQIHEGNTAMSTMPTNEKSRKQHRCQIPTPDGLSQCSKPAVGRTTADYQVYVCDEHFVAAQRLAFAPFTFEELESGKGVVHPIR